LERFQVPARHSEDVAHDAFFVLWRQFDKYDETRPIKPWLYVFVAHMASDYHALACHSHEVLTARDPEILDEVPSAEDSMLAEEERQVALQAVDGLEPALHEVLNLHFTGCTGPEIAATLGIPLNTAYCRLRRAGESVRRYASCVLAERERRQQIREVFPAAVPGRRSGDERPPRSKKRFDLRPRAARHVDKQGVRNQISG
jgi:RNA polymerase sigma-70 factor (ECF subfamily)